MADARPSVDAGAHSDAAASGTPEAGSVTTSDGGGCSVGGSPSGNALWFVVLGLCALVRRRQRKGGDAIAQ